MSVPDFICQFRGDQFRTLTFLHDWLSSDYNLQGKMRYSIPFYYQQSWICYLNPLKDAKVELAFTRANELSNAQGMLRFNGRKQVAGITIAKAADIDIDPLTQLLNEAVLLDEKVPYASKRKKTL